MINLPGPQYAGRYRIDLIRGDAVTYSTGWFDNLITDLGLDQLANVALGTGSVPYLMTQCFLGSGDTPPAFTDTHLDALVGSSNILEGGGTSSYVAGTPPYWRYVVTFTFAAGTVTGNLSEVGVGKSSTALFSRALIKNQAGSDIVVKVLADEGIQVSYEFRSYINPADVTSVMHLSNNTNPSGTDYSLLVRPANMSVAKSIYIGMGYSRNNVALYSGNIQSNTQAPTGSATSLTSYVNIQTYVPGSFQLTFKFTFLETVGNYTEGVKAIRVSNQQCDFQMQVTPPIMKTSSYILTLSVTLSWGRYAP